MAKRKRKPMFDCYVGVDYSGAGKPTARSATIQVYRAWGREEPVRVDSPASTEIRKRNFNRIELHQWLNELLSQKKKVIIGIDHGFSFPLSYFERYKLKSWDDFLSDFVKHWPTDGVDSTVEQYRVASKRTGNSKELRLTERWTSSAKSVFQFDVQGSVAKSTHAGLPWLYKMRNANPGLHFWPFDGFDIAAGRSAVLEIYPSVFRNRYDRSGRTVDQQDAYAVCRWLSEMDSRFGLERFFDPPLDQSQRAIARREGWIFGVT